MNQVNKTEREILVILSKGNKEVDSFTLFKRLRTSFAEFSRSVNFLLKNSYIKVDGNKIRLTPKGNELVIIGNKSSGSNKQWRNIPDRFMKNSISADEPYVPSRKLLDERSFKKLNFDIK